MINIGVGSQVVCIHDGLWWYVDQRGYSFPAQDHLPVYRMVYTVRGIIRDDNCFVGLLLEEIHNVLAVYKSEPTSIEPSFDARGFRPVKKTSIDEFTALLNPAPMEPSRTTPKKRELV